jgi:ribonuclease HI
MCFSTQGNLGVHIEVRNTTFKVVEEKRLLGVIFDNKLSFRPHITQTVSKIKGMIAKLNVLTHGLKGGSADFMLMLYKCCVRPHIEFGYAVWCSASDIAELLSLQNLALRRCTGTMQATPANALEVITGVIPLDLRLDHVLLCTFLRISRNNDLLLKSKVESLLRNATFMDHKILTSLHKFTMASKNLAKDLDKVEPIIHFSIEHLINANPTAVNLTDFDKFGSSNSRSDVQKEAALTTAIQYLNATSTDIVAFTDGSALGNPGPCGAGAAIYWNGISGQPTHHTKAVSKNSSSYHGELQAILLALDAVAGRGPTVHDRKVHIITDCQSAVHAIAKCHVNQNHGFVLNKVKTLVKTLHSRNVQITVYWTAGHINLCGNDIADDLAKRAAIIAETLHNDEPISTSEAKATIKKLNCKRWQKRWDMASTGRYTYGLFPIASEGGYKCPGIRASETKLNRLRTGTTLLKDHMYKILPNFYPSPNCQCGLSRETIEHLLFHCTLYTDIRTDLIADIEILFIKNNVPAHKRFINTQVLLGRPDYLPRHLITQLQARVAYFIQATNASIKPAS